jgi:hypothetical protein
MVLALTRVLSIGGRCRSLKPFLNTEIYLRPPPLRLFDGFPDLLHNIGAKKGDSLEQEDDSDWNFI